MKIFRLLQLASGALMLIAFGAFSNSTKAATTNYQYDSLGRVIKVVYPNLKQICYAYDATGNRTQINRQATGSCSVTGSTLSSSMTAETMLAAQQANDLQASSAMTSEDQVATDGTTAAASTTDTPVQGN